MQDRADLGEISRRRFLRLASVSVLTATGVSVLGACGGLASEKAQAPARGVATTLYRQEGCSYCTTYADYLSKNGFSVEVKTLDDLDPIREKYGIPDEAVGCHTSVMEGYVVEGHVPVEAIDRLLLERPSLDGISVVGMPVNSPGMGEPDGQPLDVLSFRSGRVESYLSVNTF